MFIKCLDMPFLLLKPYKITSSEKKNTIVGGKIWTRGIEGMTHGEYDSKL